MRRSIACSVLVTGFSLLMLARPTLGVDGPAAAPGKRPAARPTTRPVDNSERAKWENRIVLFGDEGTFEWSIRIRDKDVDMQRQFRLRELWMYDRGTKRWVKQGTTQITSTMVTADRKARNPNDPENDNDQILAVLPIEKDQFGLFYAKWTVDDIKGSTFCRIGPGLREKDNPILHRNPPEGMITAVVPIDITHAEAAIIPDPRVACELDH